MKRILGLFLCIGFGCMGLSAAQNNETQPPKKQFNHKFQITRKYDKGKDKSTVTLKPMPITTSLAKEVTDLKQVPQIDLEVFFTYQGEQPSKPAETATLALHSLARSAVYRQPQDLIAVVNGERALMLGKTTYKSVSKTFMFEEIMSIEVPLDTMKKMSGAKTLNLYLAHQRELKLTDSQLEAIRDITSRMSP
jgi:hypothetical protein